MNENSKFDEELMARAARLPTSVAPERELWPAIEAAINTPVRPARSAWNSVWAQAAAVILLVGASSALTYTVVKDGGSTITPVSAEISQLVFEPVSGSFGSQYNLGPDYQDARRDLVAGFERELERMEPETRADILANIATIKQAIRDINLSLAEEPDNVLLQRLLLSTYREELSLMIRVEGISSATMRRNDI